MIVLTLQTSGGNFSTLVDMWTDICTRLAAGLSDDLDYQVEPGASFGNNSSQVQIDVSDNGLKFNGYNIRIRTNPANKNSTATLRGNYLLNYINYSASNAGTIYIRQLNLCVQDNEPFFAARCTTGPAVDDKLTIKIERCNYIQGLGDFIFLKSTRSPGPDSSISNSNIILAGSSGSNSIDTTGSSFNNCAVAVWSATAKSVVNGGACRTCTFWNYGGGGFNFSGNVPVDKREANLYFVEDPLQSAFDSIADIQSRVLRPSAASSSLRYLADLAYIPSLDGSYEDIVGKPLA